MKKIILKYLLMFTLIIIVFKNGNIIKNNIYETYEYFIKNILPSLFPLMFISLYLKHNVLNKTNNRFIIYTILCVSFTPSNALITNDKNIILFTWIINPFYSYFTIKNILNQKYALYITFTNLIINYIFLFIYLVKNKNIKINEIKNKNINEIVKETTINIINIFGITLLFSCVINILKIYNFPVCLSIYLDIINGFKLIKSIKHFCLISIIFLNTFTGLNIYFQIKSINNNINVKDLLKKIIISIFITIITYIILN